MSDKKKHKLRKIVIGVLLILVFAALIGIFTAAVWRFGGRNDAVLIATPAPTASAAPTITPIPTAEPTSIPTIEPTKAPTATPTAVPTAKPTKEPTPSPTAVPTKEPVPTPTAAPTAVPTAEPTAEPTPAATSVPTATPVFVPDETPIPTKVPTPVPTAEVTPTAAPTAADEAEKIAEPVMTPVPAAIVFEKGSYLGQVRLRAGATANVRLEPSLEAEVISRVADGSFIHVSGKTGEWYYFSGKDADRQQIEGYIHKTFVSLVADAENEAVLEVAATPDPAYQAWSGRIKVNAASVNVRLGPGEDHEILGRMVNKAAVEVLDEENGWYLIRGLSQDREMVVGYVFAKYVRAAE